MTKQHMSAKKSKPKIKNLRKRASSKPDSASQVKTKRRYTQITESKSMPDESANILVNVDVHAEVNASVFNVDKVKIPNASPCEKIAFSKRLMLETSDQSRISNEIFAIQDSVDWKIVSKNLDQYRIKSEDHHTASHLTVSVVKT